MKKPSSHGSGEFEKEQFHSLGDGVVIENGVLVFHPENIKIGNNVYIGHNTILKGYHKNYMEIGEGSWIGQQCFFHSAGGLQIGKNVGVGPSVKIITSNHNDIDSDLPIIHQPLKFAPVVIGDGSDIGVGAIILPGVTIGHYVQIGAGSVVNTDIPPFTVAAGVPSKIIRTRDRKNFTTG